MGVATQAVKRLEQQARSTATRFEQTFAKEREKQLREKEDKGKLVCD